MDIVNSIKENVQNACVSAYKAYKKNENRNDAIIAVASAALSLSCAFYGYVLFQQCVVVCVGAAISPFVHVPMIIFNKSFKPNYDPLFAGIDVAIHRIYRCYQGSLLGLGILGVLAYKHRPSFSFF